MKHHRSRRGQDNPYSVLGVDTGASQQDITRAYRRAAQRLHPDTQPDDPQAAARFQALADAYDLLRDPDRRSHYDHAQPADEPARPAILHWLTADSPHSAGQSYLLWQAPGLPVRAGPVRTWPPAAAGPQGQGGDPAAARFEDPPVILDARPPGPGSGWPW